MCNAANSSKDDFKDVDNDGNEEEDDDDDEEDDGNEENAQFAEVSVLGCSPQLSTSTEKE